MTGMLSTARAHFSSKSLSLARKINHSLDIANNSRFQTPNLFDICMRMQLTGSFERLDLYLEFRESSGNFQRCLTFIIMTTLDILQQQRCRGI
jgi:hypothetical protein